jgi:hypothetical protein
MKIRITVNYFGKQAEVLEFNKTHVLIKFENGNKLCTTKTAFNR